MSLAACPFCKGRNCLVNVDPVSHLPPDCIFVKCYSCGAQGPLRASPEEAEDAWGEDQ